ncbi:hypothetical protein L3V86_09310 [Thiotrichales bacterium 19S11-10]|nr:hypothetical protein [Thiotrichales bacterium 19S11-10]
MRFKLFYFINTDTVDLKTYSLSSEIQIKRVSDDDLKLYEETIDLLKSTMQDYNQRFLQRLVNEHKHLYCIDIGDNDFNLEFITSICSVYLKDSKLLLTLSGKRVDCNEKDFNFDDHVKFNIRVLNFDYYFNIDLKNKGYQNDELSNCLENIKLALQQKDDNYLNHLLSMYRSYSDHKKPHLKILESFMIIEGFLTHKPRPNDSVGTIVHQVTYKLKYLNDLFFEEKINFNIFSDDSELIGQSTQNESRDIEILEELYNLRSHIAHGEHYDPLNIKQKNNKVKKRIEETVKKTYSLDSDMLLNILNQVCISLFKTYIHHTEHLKLLKAI